MEKPPQGADPPVYSLAEASEYMGKYIQITNPVNPDFYYSLMKLLCQVFH